jgi:hypothetical protein
MESGDEREGEVKLIENIKDEWVDQQTQVDSETPQPNIHSN